MDVEPIVHVIEVLLESLFFGRWIASVLEFVGWGIVSEVEPGDVESQEDSDEVVHLEEEAERSLFKLVDDGEELDHFVHTSQTEVNE